MRNVRSEKAEVVLEHEASHMVCSCGFMSSEKCREIFETILIKEFSDFRYAKVHRLTVDTYALQHPHVYMISAKSFAAHLTGMCCAMEFGNDPDLLRLLQQWLNGEKQLEKPQMLENLGSLTISHVAYAKDASEHIKLVHEWAADVWSAYSVYHHLARDWIETAKYEQQT
jgi:hypothetical protein